MGQSTTDKKEGEKRDEEKSFIYSAGTIYAGRDSCRYIWRNGGMSGRK